MVATVRVLDNGTFKGASSNLTSYSYKDESTPLNIADSSGGVPELTFDVAVTDDTALLYRSEVEFKDGAVTVVGRVTGVDTSDATASVPLRSDLAGLVATRNLPPVAGTLSTAIRAYLDACGLSQMPLVFTPVSAGSRVVAYPGGEHEVWVWLKEVLASQGLEALYVSGALYVGDIAAMYAANAATYQTPDPARDTTRGLSISEGELARNVEIKYYNNVYAANELVYPQGGWNEDVQVYQVDAGEVQEHEIETGVSIVSFKQPTMVSFVAADYTGPNSVYAIAGNDGLPVPADLWRDAGGKVEIELAPDTTTLLLKLTGPVGTWAENYGPFRLAMAADTGGGSAYSSLRINGSGVFMHEASIIVPTGVEDDDTAQDVGITVESRAVMHRSQAYDLAPAVASAYAGTNIEKSGGLARDEKKWWLFGLSGAHVRTADALYRIRTVNYGPTTADYTAEPFTRFSDLDDVWGGGSFAEFETLYAGYTFTDLGIRPLLPAKELPKPW